jgi:hypothetical protein
LALEHITTFNCANVNGNTVILTVTDVNSNTAPARQRDHRRQRRANRALPERHCAIGQHWKWFDTAASVNNGSSDNCAIASLA